MEGDGVRWGSEPVSGPGPGGGGMIRDLCRGFGRYRRYLGRLRQNLHETQKFFRDIKGSHSHSCPSSPTGGGEAQRGPAGDVAETGLQAGEKGSREGARAGEAHWRVGRTPALQSRPGKRREVGEGPRGPARGPAPAGSAMPWEGIPPRVGGGAARSRRGGPWGARGVRRQAFREQDQGDPVDRGRERGGPVCGEGGGPPEEWVKLL